MVQLALVEDVTKSWGDVVGVEHDGLLVRDDGKLLGNAQLTHTNHGAGMISKSVDIDGNRGKEWRTGGGANLKNLRKKPD